LPSLLGRPEVEVVLGKGSGVDSVDNWLAKIGMQASPEQIMDLVVLVKEKSMEKRGLLTEEEFRELATRYLAL
jgi:isopropylmalate/homocitrate/citramalate synthase